MENWHSVAASMVQYIITNQNFDWERLDIDTSKAQILSYSQYLEQKKPSLLDEIGIHNLEPHEASLIFKMFNDQDYLPTRGILKGTFQNRSTTQLCDLLKRLGKNTRAIDDVILSKDYENIFDGTEQVNSI